MTQPTQPTKPTETWVPMCPQCGSGHIILSSKPLQEALVTCMCYECKHNMTVDQVQFKRL